jgi:ComF family protein
LGFFDAMSNLMLDAAIQLLRNSAAAFGQDCALCGASSCRSLLCAPCADALPRIARACERCAIPLASQARYCGACVKRSRHAFDDGHAVFEYGFPVDRLVQRFKYAGDLAVGHWLAEALAHAAARLPRPDLLVVPPLARRTLRRRGFNQALVLARHAARSLGVRCEIEAIAKVRETPAQQGLDRGQRLANLRGAFRCALHLEGAHVAIVDDVITTGATADVLARLLRERGAARVSAWAVARTPDPALR